jgi:ribosomal protein L40E
MAQPEMEITQQPQKGKINSPTGIVLTGYEKGIALCVVLGIMYVRLARRKRNKEKICAHCGKRNPPHQTNCIDCSAPLFVK